MSTRLQRYLAARRAGGWGWRPRYEEAEAPNETAAWFAGHYTALLEEMIGYLGQDTAERLVEAHADVEAAAATPEDPGGAS